MADERLQMFSANLRSGVNPVAQVPHHSGERIKRFAPRLSCEVRATQLIADPLKIRLKLCFPAHRSPTLVISIRTSGHSRQETFLPFSIASGRMCIESGRLSFVASQQHVPVAWAAAHARGVRSRLPLEGRSRWLTSTEGASLRSFG
jgi:hypothetical protein